MRLGRLLALTALATFAFGIIGVAAVDAEEAEEKNNPRILCLTEKCRELKITLEGKASSVETLGGLTLSAETAKATISGCEELTAKDIIKCKDQDLLFTGVKKGEQLCNTEGLSAEKGEVLALLDLTIAAEETSAKVLQPVLLMKYLNAKLEAKLLIKCGVVKVELKGALGCLIPPGLVNVATTQSVEIKCQLNKTNHDPVIGTCTVPVAACETLKTEPFEAKFGEKFEDAWLELALHGNPSKDIFIDD
jgi:hypothetical protein